MTLTEIKVRAESMGLWYHEIELYPGYVPPSSMADARPIWDMIRKVRSGMDYSGKSVLDIGTMSGMWAFEAEKIGARTVVAADIYQHAPVQKPYGQTTYEHFLLARACLGSRAILVPNGNAHDISNLTSSLRSNLGLDGFDIIQSLGLLYHLENPLLALGQMRKCCVKGGQMLIETAICTSGGDEPFMRFNSDSKVYCDTTTFWAPNIPCLKGMLRSCGWEPGDHASISTHGRDDIHRAALVAQAI